jgi:hypothetical protein
MICALVFASSTGAAATISVKTNQGTGQDGLAYAGIPAGAFSSVFNIIAVGNTTGDVHNTIALTQFQIPALESPQLIKAELKVTSASAKQFNSNLLDPDATHQIPVGVSQITSAWTRAGLSWNTQPTHGANGASFNVDALATTYTIDVTNLLTTFLDNSNDTNFGLWLQATAVVGTDPFYAVGFLSGFQAGSGLPQANGPELVITTVPEPTSVLLALVAAPALVWAGVRRARNRRQGS